MSKHPPTKTIIDFTCEHCGRPVPRELGKDPPRNHCPFCLWSKHVELGDQVDYPPCGALMRGVDVSDGDGAEVVWRCLGCGFVMRGPTDDYMSRTLPATGLVKGLTVTFYERPELEDETEETAE